MCFDFRRARSHPLGPTITGRLTGWVRNVHAGMSACQGGNINTELTKENQCTHVTARIKSRVVRFHAPQKHESLPRCRQRSVGAARHDIDPGGVRSDKKCVLML